MPRGKRREPDQKLAEEIKKKIGYRNKPQTCAQCFHSEEDPSSDNPGGICCNIYDGLVTFVVDPGANCDMFKKKRKTRKKKETEGGEVEPEQKSKKKKKKKK